MNKRKLTYYIMQGLMTTISIVSLLFVSAVAVVWFLEMVLDIKL